MKNTDQQFFAELRSSFEGFEPEVPGQIYRGIRQKMKKRRFVLWGLHLNAWTGIVVGIGLCWALFGVDYSTEEARPAIQPDLDKGNAALMNKPSAVTAESEADFNVEKTTTLITEASTNEAPNNGGQERTNKAQIAKSSSNEIASKESSNSSQSQNQKDQNGMVSNEDSNTFGFESSNDINENDAVVDVEEMSETKKMTDTDEKAIDPLTQETEEKSYKSENAGTITLKVTEKKRVEIEAEKDKKKK